MYGFHVTISGSWLSEYNSAALFSAQLNLGVQSNV